MKQLINEEDSTFSRSIEKSITYLKSVDPILEQVIINTKRPSFSPHTDYYWALVDSIISQQLSVKSAAAIEKRFRQLFNEEVPEPKHILEKTVDELKSVGLSRPKALYILDLAGHIESGKLTFEHFNSASNFEIISELTDVKGIGVWTTHMFLIFCMGRLDVLAIGDYGIRAGIKNLYGFEEMPTPNEVSVLSKRNKWHPYESVACWYIWQSIDNKPSV